MSDLPSLDLRPFTLGEILDRSLRILRGSFKKLFFLVVAFQLLSYVATKAFQYVGYERFPHYLRPGLFAATPPQPAVLIRETLWLFATGAAFWAVFLAVSELQLAAVTVTGRRAFLGEAVDVADALRQTMRRAVTLLGTALLTTLWFAVLFTLAGIPGAALVAYALFDPGRAFAAWFLGGLALFAVCEVPAMLWAFLKYSLVSQVVVLEGLGYVRALRRSRLLMGGRVPPPATRKSSFADNVMLRASVVYAVILAVNVSVASLAAVPHLAVNLAYGNNPLAPHAVDPLAVPAYALLPVEFFSVLLQSAVAPFSLLALVVFYFDLRIRREGFDIDVLAGALDRDATKPAGASPTRHGAPA